MRLFLSLSLSLPPPLPSISTLLLRSHSHAHHPRLIRILCRGSRAILTDSSKHLFQFLFSSPLPDSSLRSGSRWDSILPDLFCGSQIRSLCIFRGQLPLPPAPPPSPLPPPSKSPFGSTCRHFHRFCLFHCFVFPLFAPFEVFCRRCCRNEAKQKTNAATESK